MAISSNEMQFNEQVSNAPIVKEILKDLDGLKKGQVKLEDKVESLEKKVDGGFKDLTNEIKSLAKEIRDDKEQKLIEANKKLSDTLDRKQSNSDKIKNGSITGLILAVGGFILENLGLINITG